MLVAALAPVDWIVRRRREGDRMNYYFTALMHAVPMESSFSPDLCHSQNWNPIVASGPQSQIAIVLAGFVFAAIVVILSVRVRTRQREAAQALKLLFTAFFGLGVTAYLLGDVTGDQVCPRAETTEVLTGGDLGAFTVIMIVALTWLVIAYQDHVEDLLTFLHCLVTVSCIFVILLLSTSATNYVSADLPNEPHGMVYFLVYLTGSLASVGLVTWIWLHPKMRLVKTSSEINKNISLISNRAVTRCAWSALAYLAVSAVASGIETSLPPSIWYPTPILWVVYLAAWSSLILPLLVLGLGITGLARTKR
jgi:hypothetical protein